MGYAGKVFSALGVGGVSATSEVAWTKGFPYLILIGPSGNVCRAPTPSGLTASYNDGFTIHNANQAYFNAGVLFASKCLCWGGNELVFGVRIAHGVLEDVKLYSFAPYGLSHRLKNWIPDTLYNEPQKYGTASYNRSYTLQGIETIIHDGTYYRNLHRANDTNATYGSAGLIHISDKCHLFTDIPSITGAGMRYRAEYQYGLYPVFHSAGETIMGGTSTGSGYIPVFHGFAHIGNDAFSLGSASFGGNANRRYTDLMEQNLLDVPLQFEPVYHGGLIYVVKEDNIHVVQPTAANAWGGVPILREGIKDIPQPDNSVYASLTTYSEARTNTFGAYYKCPIKWGNRLLFLQNDGKLLEASEGKVTQLVNIPTVVATQYASGIWGGTMGAGLPNAAAGDSGPDSFKCFGAKLGNNLNVFLNYRITEGGASRTGVFWAISSNLASFTDKTTLLPQSGIIPPSGLSSADYLTLISPYKFSGYENFNTVVAGKPNGATKCEPSGWNQKTGINDEWSGSGIFQNNDYSLEPSSWDVPMDYSSLTKYLYPTLLIEPSGFSEVGLSPMGVAHSGLKWTGVDGYHIFGWKDEVEEKLHLIFTQDDFDESKIQASGYKNQNLYYILDEDGNWQYMNQFRCKRISWFEPTDMHEPSIILPSGDLKTKLYPFEDRVNKVVWQPFRVHDWPYFGNIDVQVQYSTNQGNSWSNATPHALSSGITNISTGSFSVDPSGIIGKEYMFAWDYSSDIGGRTVVPWVQLRFRGVG